MNSHNEDIQNIQISVSEIKQSFTTQNIKKINSWQLASEIMKPFTTQNE